MRRVSAIALALSLASPALALQVRDAGDNARITAVVAAGEISRITIEGDRARMVNGDPAVDITHDEITGDVYLKAKAPPLTKPLNLFVATEKGFTYQLLLTPKMVPSEQILIRNGNAAAGPAQAMEWESRTPFFQSLIAVMKATVGAGPLPAGYRREKRTGFEERMGPLTIKPLHTVTGSALQGAAVEIRNATSDSLVLSEKALFEPGHAAIYLPRRILGPGESVRAYVVRRLAGGEQ